MKFSYTWLQEHIDGTLPDTTTFADVVSVKSLEVEEVHGDIVDIKVLPHRAHDCLSHRGLAYEVASLFNLPRKKIDIPEVTHIDTLTVSVNVQDTLLCPRYIAVRINNITIDPSPSWLKEKLESIGQRSISNIVDITNFVMNDMGQPMHAFDADKVVGGITVRLALPGETITTLDGKDYTLSGTETVIADDEGVLALAGIKGGTKALVDASTKNIILESANFNGTRTRKTSDTLSLRTDASKRFESEITSEYALEAMLQACALVQEMCPQAEIGKVVDVYPVKETKRTVSVSVADINRVLGSTYTQSDVDGVFTASSFDFTKEGDVYHVTPPLSRLDINIKEDLIEEVGRSIGYDTLPAVLPELKRTGLPHKRLFYEMKIRNILLAQGYSDVYTYTFGNVGDVEIIKGLAEDKEKLRTNIGAGIQKALTMNLAHTPLLGTDTVRIFEFGNVFNGEMETRHLAIGVDDGKKKSQFKDEVATVLLLIKESLGAETFDYTTTSEKPCVIELNFDTLIVSLPEPTSYEALTQEITHRGETTVYKTVSPYPHIVRDIAVWVPEGVTWEDIHTLAQRITSPLIVRIDCFDTFTKDLDGIKKTSFAFRFVLQSHERTLTDDEANKVADEMYALLKEKGYEIR